MYSLIKRIQKTLIRRSRRLSQISTLPNRERRKLFLLGNLGLDLSGGLDFSSGLDLSSGLDISSRGLGGVNLPVPVEDVVKEVAGVEWDWDVIKGLDETWAAVVAWAISVSATTIVSSTAAIIPSAASIISTAAASITTASSAASIAAASTTAAATTATAATVAASTCGAC
jgi:hypothetical protein